MIFIILRVYFDVSTVSVELLKYGFIYKIMTKKVFEKKIDNNFVFFFENFILRRVTCAYIIRADDIFDLPKFLNYSWKLYYNNRYIYIINRIIIPKDSVFHRFLLRTFDDIRNIFISIYFFIRNYSKSNRTDYININIIVSFKNDHHKRVVINIIYSRYNTNHTSY